MPSRVTHIEDMETGDTEMMIIDENTSRADLEHAAIWECDFDLDVIAAASDAKLLDMILTWIEEGNEAA